MNMNDASMLFLERGHFGKINCKGECLRKEKREIGNSVENNGEGFG